MIVWLNGAFGAGKTTAAQELLDLLPGSTLFDPELVGRGLKEMLPAKRLDDVDDLQDLSSWRRLVVDAAAALLTEVPGPLITPMTLLRQEYRDEIFGGLAARRIPVRHVLLHAEETILRDRIALREEREEWEDRETRDRQEEGAEREDREDREGTAVNGAVVASGPVAPVTPDGSSGRSGPSGREDSSAFGPPGAGSGAVADPGSDTGSDTGRAAAARTRTWSLAHLAPYREALAWLRTDAHVIDTSAIGPRQTAERIAEAVRNGSGACDIVQTPEPTAETLAAGVLLFDEEDRVLLVDPTYKPGWEFPGGVVEPGEPPARAGVREVTEELGILLPTMPRLLVLDWEAPVPPGFGGLRLLFDGGRLPDEQIRDLQLPGSELRAWRFVTEEEAESMLPPVRWNRLRWALRARAQNRTLNLEAGVPVG
ncbi:NUDIX hydrolase [Streptomyces niger]|uniref:NUDIX hydrolase n=1 Tax=Streptomyces niger TaxID=66373 RepID=UPI00069A0D64|nr:NUDIX hydrolase [Streptomyces niger]